MSEPCLGGWPLQGRAPELQRVLGWLATDQRVVELAGPEGVGRSRLVRELASRLAEEGRVVEQLLAVPSEGGVALAPLLSLAAQGSGGLAERLLRWLDGHDKPVVIVIDDAHLLDASSSHALLVAAARGATQVVACLQSEATLTTAVRRLLSQDGPQLLLAPLDTAAMAKILAAALGEVDALSARRLLDRAEGRPAWLRALLRAGLAVDALTRQGDVWSWRPGVELPAPRLALLQAVAGLDAQARRAVELVALGGELTPGELALVAGGKSLEQAFSSGIVRLVTSRRRRWVRLTHLVDAGHVLSSLDDHGRRKLGEQLLRCCARSPGRRRDDPARAVLPALRVDADVPAEEIVRTAHRMRAVDPRVVELLTRTALDRADDDALLAEARWLLADALEKTGRHAEAVQVVRAGEPSPDAASAAFQTVQIVGNQLWAGGEHDQALAAEELSATDLDSAGGDELVAMGVWMHAFPGHAIRAASLARALLADSRCGDRARVWASTGLVLALAALGRADQVPAVLQPARAAAHRLPDEPYAVDQLGWVECFALVTAGDIRRGLALARQGCDLALTGQDPARLGAWMAVRGFAGSAAGLLEAAAADLRQVQALLDPAGTGGSYGAGALAASQRAMLLAQQGQRHAAQHLLHEVRATGALDNAGVGLLHLLHAQHLVWAGLTSPVELLALAQASASELPALALAAASDALRLGAIRPALPLIRQVAPQVAGPAGRSWQLAAQALARPEATGLEQAVEVLALAGATPLAAELLELGARRRKPVDAARTRLRRDALLSTLEPCASPLLARARGGLTAREKQVALLAAEHEPTRRIAEQLGVSVRTVENHLARAYLKLGVNDRQGLREVLTRPST